MKLSELVAFKNALDEVDVQSIRINTDLEVGKILHLVETQYQNNQSHLKQLQGYNQQMHDVFTGVDNTLSQLRVQVEKEIEQQEKHWFQESYRLFEEEMRNEHHDYILNRRPQVKPQTELRSRLRMYADWRYPGMIIRPGLETFAQEMVGQDPLYLVDLNLDLLRKVPLINNFTPEYTARLRFVTIEESVEQTMLNKIPDGQFGLCLAFNFFNFRPLEYIRKYLAEIYTKLRPGGVLILTYNDCDRLPGVVLAETHYACYTPGRLVTQLVENLGYDRPYTWHDDGPMTFLEIRKPGELTSLRGGQTLAKIMLK